MALAYADRVYETTTTTGTGTIDLGGAVTGGYQTFVAGIGSTNTCYYCIVDSANNAWEVGLGTVTDATPDTLSRTTVLASSNANALVNFAAGTKDVFCVRPAQNGQLNFADGVGLVSETGAELKTGAGGGTWQTIPASSLAASFIAQDDSTNQRVNLVKGDGVGGWESYFLQSDGSTKLLNLDHTDNLVQITATSLDLTSTDILIDNDTGFTSDAGGVLKTGPGGKTWQGIPGDTSASGLASCNNSGDPLVQLTRGDGSGGWNSVFFDDTLTVNLLDIDHIGDKVTLGCDIDLNGNNIIGSISSLSDVSLLSPATGQILEYNGDSFDTIASDLTPLGFWKLDETTGPTASDSSGNSYSGTYSGMASFDNTGLVNKAVEFESTTPSYISIADNTALRISTSISVVALIKLGTDLNNPQIIISKSSGSGSSSGNYQFYLSDSSNKLYFSFWRSSGVNEYYTQDGTTDLHDGNWHVVGMSHTYGSSGSTKLFIDGSEVAGTWSGQDGSGSPFTSTDPVKIGARSIDNTLPFDGFMDRVVLYNSYLSAANHLALYNAAIGNPNFTNVTPTYISNVVEDTTPQLGGDLDTQAFKITGDFSNATVASRSRIETTTTDGNTNVIANPNGTGNAAAYIVVDESSVTNSSFGTLTKNTNGVEIISSAFGTGGTDDLVMRVNAGPKIRLNAATDDIEFWPNNTLSAIIESNGTINVANVTNYETLVTLDDDIPNKKYVDDAVAGAGGINNVVEDTTPELGGDLDLNGFNIIGDFNSASAPNTRAAFVSNTLNTGTVVQVEPNGTGDGAFFVVYEDPDVANTQFAGVGCDSNSARVFSGVTGTGTLKPLTFRIGPTNWFQIETDGTLSSLNTTYENLVTADDDIPNKKYVDDAITAGSGISNVLEDTTPQLGGTLDVNGNDIVSNVAGDTINITAADHSGTPGDVRLYAGSATSTGAGGSVYLMGGHGGSTNNEGFIYLRPGKDSANDAGRVIISGPDVATGAATLQFREAVPNGFNSIGLKAPNSVSSDRTWILPADNPITASGRFLTTDNTGAWSFAVPDTGISNLVEDTTPQLGGTLDMNSQVVTGPFKVQGSNPIVATNATSGSAILQFQENGTTKFQHYWEPTGGTGRIQVLDNSVTYDQASIIIYETGKIEFWTGGTGSTNATHKFTIEANGTLSSALTAYETLVTADDDIPNKKYVDDAITAAGVGGINNVVEDLTPQLGGDLDLNGHDITGDWTSSANLRDRFVTSVVNGTTGLIQTPNGTGNGAFYTLYALNDVNNTNTLSIGTTTTQAYIGTAQNGTGTTQDLTLRVDSVPKLTIGTDDTISVGAGVDFIFPGSTSIQGDWSSAAASRTRFETSTLNGSTGLIVAPNGTGTSSFLTLYNDSDVDNAQTLALNNLGGLVSVSAGKNGTGTVRPLALISNDNEGLRVNTDGQVAIASEINASTSTLFTGDFTNATVNNRFAFQNEAANSPSVVIAKPNGTGDGSYWMAAAESDLTNSDYIYIHAGSTEARLQTGAFGTGTAKNISFYPGNGNKTLVLDTSQRAIFGPTASAPIGIEAGSVCITTGDSGVSGGVTDADDLVIENDTNCGITIATPATATGSVRFADPGGSQRGIIAYDHNVDDMYFSTAGSEAVRIDDVGDVGIGTTATSGRLRVNDSRSTSYCIYAQSTHSTDPRGIQVNFATGQNSTEQAFIFVDGATTRFSVKSNGGIDNFQSNDTDLSDERLKKDITPLGSYWDKIKSIEVVTYKYKDQTTDLDNIGVIAQQVESVAPEFVNDGGFAGEDNDYKSIYNKDMYFAAIKALQEAMERIEILEKKLEER